MQPSITISSHLLAWHLEAFTWKIQRSAAEPSVENEWVERANSEIAPLRPWIRPRGDAMIEISLGTAAILILTMAEYMLVMEDSEDPLTAGRNLADLTRIFDEKVAEQGGLPTSSEILRNAVAEVWPLQVLRKFYD